MDSTPFSKKCEILADAYLDFINDPEWETFFDSQDLGVPLALLIMNGACEPTDVGRIFIDESWNALCELLDIDFFGAYESLETMLEFSDLWESNEE